MSRFVAVEIDGGVEIHLPAGAAGAYLTLCGLDGDDLDVGQQPADVPRGAKVNCDTCRDIWATARRFRASDFEGSR